MSLITTKQQLHDELNQIAPDQVRVIHEMSDIRNLDSDALSLSDYRELICEEADASVACGDERDADVQEHYAKQLLEIADRIDVQHNWKVVVWDFEDGVSAIVEQPYRPDDVPVALLPPKSKYDALLLAAPKLLAACKAAKLRLEIESRNWDVGGDKILESDAYKMIVSAIDNASEKVTGIDL